MLYFISVHRLNGTEPSTDAETSRQLVVKKTVNKQRASSRSKNREAADVILSLNSVPLSVV